MIVQATCNVSSSACVIFTVYVARISASVGWLAFAGTNLVFGAHESEFYDRLGGSASKVTTTIPLNEE